MSLPKLDAGKRVGDQAYDAIHDAIMKGEYPAGRRLQIRDLAAQLGTSAMPVREAIKRLEEQGLVETAPYRGAEVKRFTRQELLDVYAVRKLLESSASQQGALAITPNQISQVERTYAKMADALEKSRVIDYLNLDEALLTIIYSAAGNPVLLDSIEVLWRRCRTYKIFGARNEMESGKASELLVHQQRLIEAARAHDGELAAKITNESLDAAIRRIRRGMPAHPER